MKKLYDKIYQIQIRN